MTSMVTFRFSELIMDIEGDRALRSRCGASFSAVSRETATVAIP